MVEKQLLHAQQVSVQLFDAIEAASLIAPGKTEEQLNAAVCSLAQHDFGIY